MEHRGTCYGLMSININVASLGMWHLQSTPSSLLLLDFPANTANPYNTSSIMFVVKYRLLQDFLWLRSSVHAVKAHAAV